MSHIRKVVQNAWDGDAGVHGPIWAPSPHRTWASRSAPRSRGPGLHALLEDFPRRKGGHGFRRNRAGLPGAGVPSSSRGAVTEVEAAKAPQLDRLPGLQGVHNRL
jgi:hypothetical protein